MKITTRPYAKDPSRQHVDIMFVHPLTAGKMHRTRVVAPVGLDAGAAQEWGKREGQRVLYAMIRGETGKPAAAAPDVPAEREAAPQQTTDDMTLAELWDEFTPGYVESNKYATQQAFKYAWSWLAPILGDKPIDQIDRRAVSKLRNSMRGKVGPATRNLVVAKLGKALRWAIEEGHMSDRSVKVKAEKVPKVHRDVFTPADVDRMLGKCETIDDTVLVLLCFHGALRIGETCGLMWKDLDWTAGTMLICRNVHRGRLQPSAKGEDGLVPLSPRVISALRRLQARSDCESFVLQRQDGRHTTDFANGKRVIKLQLAAGLPGAGPHMLRHSALTHAANNGASPYALQAFARHAQMATTMKYYVHLNSANVARQAVGMFGDEGVVPGLPGETGNGLATAGNGP